jgi:uncharacterized protein (DUF305 family)
MMNKKILIYGAIGVVSALAIAGFFTINNNFAQSETSAQDIHHPGSATPMQTQSSPSPGMGMTGQTGQMMSGDIDQHFIVMMIPHHQGAVDMAELALTRAQHPEIKQLAEAIIRDQNREIEQMQTWYQAWYGTDVPCLMPMGMMGNSPGSREGMMGNQDMMEGNSGQGMMGNQDMMEGNSGQGMMGMHSMMIGDLETLTNADDFDQEFIRQMIPHHQMAVMMAQMVMNTGNKPEIQELSQTIIRTQTAEINQMQQWNQEWFR